MLTATQACDVALRRVCARVREEGFRVVITIMRTVMDRVTVRDKVRYGR